MNFEKDYIYHIYNQGNNRRKIFFKRYNYLYFLKKVKLYILPYADILSWCLMPNHFHLMVFVKNVELTHRVTTGHKVSSTFNSQAENPKSVRSGRTISHPVSKKRSLNDSIAIMLRSYTRAINKQKGISGSLFREATKAECLNCPEGISPSWFSDNGVTQINITDSEDEYPAACFNYIHQNPVVAGLVRKAEDWEYSSARDYLEERDSELLNRELVAEYIHSPGDSGS